MHEILLMNIAGPDQPGVTAAVTARLAAHGVNILDVGQAVIHDHLSLGLLLEVPGELEAGLVAGELELWCEPRGLQARATPISAADYEHWVSGQGKHRYIVTLLARKITAAQIAAVSHIVAEQGLNIDQIHRLSGRISLQTPSAQQKACVELSVRGQPRDTAQMQADFLQLASELEIDVAVQKDSVFRRHRRLVCFDMDSTLIEAEVIDELAKAAGVGDAVAEITERAMQGELDFSESFRARVALLKGLDESVLADIAARLPLSEGAEQLIQALRVLGYKTAILSGGFTYFGEYLQRKLGIDYVYANELDIVAGKVTGEVKGVVVDGARKAALLQQLANEQRLDLQQVIAVGDGANDLPMLSLAGLGVAFRAKPLVRETAQHAISELGLDSILYLLGVRDRDSEELLQRLS